MINWLTPSALVEQFGAWIVLVTALMILLETSTVFGAFLPGDSLLFTVGLTLSVAMPYPIFLGSALLVLAAALLGSELGYHFGRRVGPMFFSSRRSRFMSERTLVRTREFFDRYGDRALILARFVPVLRALVPTMAGAVKMNLARFRRLNLIGGVAWVLVLMHLGYLLGGVEFISKNIELFVLLFAVLSSLPMPIEILREWLKRRAEARRSAAE